MRRWAKKFFYLSCFFNLLLVVVGFATHIFFCGDVLASILLMIISIILCGCPLYFIANRSYLDVIPTRKRIRGTRSVSITEGDALFVRFVGAYFIYLLQLILFGFCIMFTYQSLIRPVLSGQLPRIECLSMSNL